MIILITGIAGSLGRAFTKLLVGEHEIIGYDNNEWAVAEFKEDFPTVKVHLSDFSEWRYNRYPCHVVVHCAAFKHLPLGEENIDSFIDNNIIKTRQLFSEAYENQVEIIFISSDKAVEPINLYGMTKAIGEYLARGYDGYIARCGNFLNSSGSVIPIWEKAIREGRPIKITDRKMIRFVIDTDDAAKQIWDGYWRGERLIIPNCTEVSLVQLLERTLNKHGLDIFGRIKTEEIGIRKGEKIREKLKWDWE